MITPPISSLLLRSMPRELKSLRPLPVTRSKRITTKMRKTPAMMLLAKPRVNAPIPEAASCAAKAKPQMTAAKRSRDDAIYFFLFINTPKISYDLF